MKTPLKDKKATEAEVENAQEAAFAKAAAELLPKLREYFGAQRWERLKRQIGELVLTLLLEQSQDEPRA